MAGRLPEDVKRELESEREHLGSAVGALRKQAGSLRRKLPLLVLGGAGAALALRTTAKRVFHRRTPGREKRGRFPFLRGD